MIYFASLVIAPVIPSNLAQFVNASGRFREDAPTEPIKLYLACTVPTLSRVEQRALHPRLKMWTDEDRVAAILAAMPSDGSKIGAQEIRVKVRFGNDVMYPMLKVMVKRKQIASERINGVLLYAARR